MKISTNTKNREGFDKFGKNLEFQRVSTWINKNNYCFKSHFTERKLNYLIPK